MKWYVLAGVLGLVARLLMPNGPWYRYRTVPAMVLLMAAGAVLEKTKTDDEQI